MKVKSFGIFAPCAILILCELVGWSHSHPAPTLELGGHAGELLAGNVKNDNKISDTRFVIPEVNSAHKADSSTKTLESVESERSQNAAKTGEDFKSLDGDGGDARISQTNKASQSKTPTQGEKKTFLQKIRSSFLDGPVKVWKKIKQRFSKANLFKSNEKKSENPDKDSPTRFAKMFKLYKSAGSKVWEKINQWFSKAHFFKSNDKISKNPEKDSPTRFAKMLNLHKSAGSNPAKETPKESSDYKVKGSPDGKLVNSPKDQQSKDITIEDPSKINNLQANMESVEPHTKEEEDPKNIKKADKSTPEKPQHQDDPQSFTSDPKEESHSEMSPKVEISNKMHPKEQKASDEPSKVSKLVLLDEKAEDFIKSVEDVINRHIPDSGEVKESNLKQKQPNPPILKEPISPLISTTDEYIKFLEDSIRSLWDAKSRYYTYSERVNQAVKERKITNPRLFWKSPSALTSPLKHPEIIKGVEPTEGSSLVLLDEEVKLLKEGGTILENAASRYSDPLISLEKVLLEIRQGKSSLRDRSFPELMEIREKVNKAFANFIQSSAT